MTWPFAEPTRSYVPIAATCTDIDVPAPAICWEAIPAIDRLHSCFEPPGHTDPHRCGTCGLRWPKETA